MGIEGGREREFSWSLPTKSLRVTIHVSHTRFSRCLASSVPTFVLRGFPASLIACSACIPARLVVRPIAWRFSRRLGERQNWREGWKRNSEGTRRGMDEMERWGTSWHSWEALPSTAKSASVCWRRGGVFFSRGVVYFVHNQFLYFRTGPRPATRLVRYDIIHWFICLK